jgi:soluble lytic murein transglycosylase-like protein
MTWWISLLLFEDASGQAARVRAQMAASLAKQRVAVQQQMKATSPYRNVSPWHWPALAPQATFACEPVAEPELGKMIDRAAQDHQVSPELVREVAREESGFRPCAVSRAGAAGLMQLMPATQVQFEVHDPLDPEQSLTAGTKLLKQLLERYNGDIALALGAYNAGSAAVDRFSAIPAYPETQNYVSDILQRLQPRAMQPPATTIAPFLP